MIDNEGVVRKASPSVPVFFGKDWNNGNENKRNRRKNRFVVSEEKIRWPKGSDSLSTTLFFTVKKVGPIGMRQ
jgi:hypothetical protein